MFRIEARIEGGINLDKIEVKVNCPRCQFSNPIWLKQARLRDVIICRGCKANIQLDDSMNTVRKGVRSFHRALDQLHDKSRASTVYSGENHAGCLCPSHTLQTPEASQAAELSRLSRFSDAFASLLHFFDSSPILSGVRDELLARVSEQDVQRAVDQILKGQAVYGDNRSRVSGDGLLPPEEDRRGARQRDLVLNIALHYHAGGKAQDCLEKVRDVFLEPFYEYVDEHLDDQQAILYFLRRYKHRCEWFHAERLRQAVRHDTQKGEKTLALDLYEYLHNQGIDFHIEPHSTSGIPDFVADQVGKDRVIADTKLFWPESSKGKSYIISGFNQAYTYACDYNEPCAYLVIFKMCHEGLNFLVPSTQSSFPSACP